MKWIGTDSADVLLVRNDSLMRVSPSLIEDLRWYESMHHQRRHPVLLIAGESQPEERLPVDGVVDLTDDADVIANGLMYWLAHSTSVRLFPRQDQHE